MRRIHRKTYLRAIGVGLALVALFGVAKLVDTYHTGQGEPIADIRSLDSALRIEYSIFAEDQSLILPPAMDYIEKNGSETLQSIKNTYRYDVERLDIGLPVTVSYEIKGMPSNTQVTAAKLEVSEDEAFTAPRRFTMGGTLCSTDVYLLKANATYYFRITIELSNGVVTGTHGSFKTADTPRILSIDGVPNVRDIGGWKTEDGMVIGQGILYRGGEMDGAVKEDYMITQTGIDHMLHILKVRTELDLRDPSVASGKVGALGEVAKRVSIHTPSYSSAFTESGKAAIGRVFETLANEDVYPVYLHDTHGMDQTGTVCYILEALLGVNEDDLMRDYRISILYHGGLHNNDMNAFVEQFNTLAGNTPKLKAETYLKSAGITDAQIATIRNIFLTQPE